MFPEIDPVLAASVRSILLGVSIKPHPLLRPFWLSWLCWLRGPPAFDASVDSAAPAARMITLEQLRVYEFARLVKMLSAGVGVMLVLLAWPTKPRGHRQTAHWTSAAKRSSSSA